MKAILLILLLAIAGTPASSSAQTTAYTCVTTVKQLLVYGSGYVNVMHSGRNDWTFICSLEAPWKGVSPTTCATWVALLESVKTKGGSVRFYFAGDGDCATLPTYQNAPAPYYVGDVTP